MAGEFGWCVFLYIGIILIFVVFIYWIMPEFSSQNYTQSPSPTSDNLQLGLEKFFHRRRSFPKRGHTLQGLTKLVCCICDATVVYDEKFHYVPMIVPRGGHGRCLSKLITVEINSITQALFACNEGVCSSASTDRRHLEQQIFKISLIIFC